MLVEDEGRLADVVAAGLRRADFTVDVVDTVADAAALASDIPYDCMILDLGLPDGDGLDLLHRLRRQRKALPILILTARDTVEDRVRGLDGGADDYVLKPFAMPELVSRIKALLRRPSATLGVQLDAGNVCFDTASGEISIAGRPVVLTRRERTLLELLMRREDRVSLKEVLEDQIYGFGEENASNSLEVLVHRLRKKLAQDEADVEIRNVRGVGYFLAKSR